MKSAVLFALTALIPASLNAAPAASLTIAGSTCAGGDRAIVIPIRPDAPPQEDNAPRCVKGCHSGSFRKRLLLDR